MSFVFSGIFANAGVDVLDDFREYFGGVGRTIEKPFVGMGVRLVGPAVNTDPEKGTDNDYATALINFSARHPVTTFVYVYAECFGGPCAYAGFAFRGGQRIHDEPFRDIAEDYSVLSRLVAHLGVETGGYFEPLERNFFGDPLAPGRAASLAPEPKRSWLQRLFGGGGPAAG
jgi:hypothetical protein